VDPLAIDHRPPEQNGQPWWQQCPPVQHAGVLLLGAASATTGTRIEVAIKRARMIFIVPGIGSSWSGRDSLVTG
jgi:hypothetical protein